MNSRYCKKLLLLTLAGTLSLSAAYAGNKERAGEAGASELLINPWASSSGFAGANTAQVTGMEAQFLNVAGLAFTRKTELMFSHTLYMKNSGVNINAFGFSQKIGAAGVIGVGVMSMNFGDIDITTSERPEGGIGTFSPSYFNLAASYARVFSNSIYGGVTLKIISESMSNAGAHGVAVDAGIRYITGKHDRMKFGIALKNVGPQMKYSGDGLSFRTSSNGKDFNITEEHRSEGFEIPSLLNIGLAYDFFLDEEEADSVSDEYIANQKLTAAINFTSNAFTKDEYRVGLEYAFKGRFMVRAGYIVRQGAFNKDYNRTQAQTGLCAGLSVKIPLNNSGTSIQIDYSYRHTDPFLGIHSIGAKFDL